MKILADQQTLSDKQVRSLLDLIRGVKLIEEVETSISKKDFLGQLSDEELLEIAKKYMLPSGSTKTISPAEAKKIKGAASE